LVNGVQLEPIQDFGFLLVKRFDVLYAEFAARPEFDRHIYALPRFGTSPHQVAKQYRGLDRDPLIPSHPPPPPHYMVAAPTPFNALESANSVLAAQMRMYELEEEDRCWRSLLFDEDGLVEILRWLEEEHEHRYETLWSKVANSEAEPPTGYRRLGYEPSSFPADHFSTVADALCFPRWHGTDDEGVLFAEHFDRLNSNALFDRPSAAEAYLDYYLSIPWTERDEFSIAEIWASDLTPSNYRFERP
jgi:hypothetical protein